MRKSVFFVINSLEGGGAERVLSTLAIDFHNRQILVKILCLNYAETRYKLPDDLQITFLVKRNSNSLLHRYCYACITFYKLFYQFLNNRPTCVISFMTTSNFWSGLSALLTKTNFIVSERTTPDYCIKPQNYLFKLILSLIYKNAQAVVVPARGIENLLKMYRGFEKLQNFKIIHNPISSLGFPSKIKVYNRKYILGVGRLSYEKGFDMLIDAYDMLKPKDIDLLIVGEGPERHKLEKRIEDLKLQKRVKMLGLKTNLSDYYSQAEVFVLSSRSEGYPNALIEAMSHGCACIAMDCEFGPSEIIKNKINGILTEAGKISDLSQALNNLLDNSFLKNKISKNALKIKQTNSLNIISSQWQRVIFNS